MTPSKFVQVQRCFGRSVFRRAVIEMGARVIVTPAGTGMIPRLPDRRYGAQAPAPMPNGVREAIYRHDSGSALTARQRRRLAHKRHRHG